MIAFTLLAIIVPIQWLDEAFDQAFYRAMTLMVAASPCALVISTPVTVLAAISNAARNGVLFKGGSHVENAGTIKAIAFDKTGTLTVGERRLTDRIPLDESKTSVDTLLVLAAAVQQYSEHSLAKATVSLASELGLPIPEAHEFRAVSGLGVEAVVDKERVRIGNIRFFQRPHLSGMEEARSVLARLEREGKTSVLVSRTKSNGTEVICGILAFADTLRPGAREVMDELRAMGVEQIVMITGDNETVARNIAAAAGVDKVYAQQLPEDKMQLLEVLETHYGAVAMVGDGINDAPALASATLGIAMGAAGTDVALETADVVLMSDDLSTLPYLIELSKKTWYTLVVNLTIAFTMIVFMVAAILIAALPLPLAVIGHEGSTVLVSLNGLRLLGFRRKRDR